MPIRPETDLVIDFLNDLVARDRSFMDKLISHRPSCNTAIAEHPTVQVGEIDGVIRTGVIGILNGFLGAFDDGPRAGWGPIAAIFAGGELIRFDRTDRMPEHQPE